MTRSLAFLLNRGNAGLDGHSNKPCMHAPGTNKKGVKRGECRNTRATQHRTARMQDLCKSYTGFIVAHYYLAIYPPFRTTLLHIPPSVEPITLFTQERLENGNPNICQRQDGAWLAWLACHFPLRMVHLGYHRKAELSRKTVLFQCAHRTCTPARPLRSPFQACEKSSLVHGEGMRNVGRGQERKG